MYGFGHNEELVGQAIKGRRVGVVLATKFGQSRRARGQDRQRLWAVGSAPAEKSLKRLGVDVIDLYYQHRVDPDRAGRGNVRRHGATRGARQSPRARHQRGAARDRPPGACGASSRGSADRILAPLPHRGGGNPPAGSARSNITFVAYSPARPRPPHRRRGGPAGTSPKPTRAAGTRASRRRISAATWRWCSGIEEMAPAKEIHPRPVGAGLALGAGRGHRANSRHEAARAPEKRMSARSE